LVGPIIPLLLLTACSLELGVPLRKKLTAELHFHWPAVCVAVVLKVRPYCITLVHLPAMVRTRRSSSYGRSLKLKDSTAKKLSWGDELNLLRKNQEKVGEKQQQQQSNKLKQVAAGGVTKKRNSNGNFNTIDAGKTPGKTLESASARKRRMNARRTSRGKTVERKLPEENIFSPPPAPKVSKLKHRTIQKSNAYLTQHPRKQQPPQVAARPVTSPVTPGVPSSASPAAGFFSFLKPFRAWAFGEQR